MAEAAEELKGYLGGSAPDPQRIGDLLDGMSHDQRVQSVRSLTRGEQSRLYSVADGFRPVTLTDLVLPGVPDLTQVRHYGRNTLPAFRIFEKRFCRPAGQSPEAPEHLYGFNFQTMQPVTGPGYFLARNAPDRPEVLVDYHQVPPEAIQGWPPVRSNERGLARFVYGFMVDTLRRVSEHVTIGSAARKGKDLGSWFVLCREA